MGKKHDSTKQSPSQHGCQEETGQPGRSANANANANTFLVLEASAPDLEETPPLTPLSALWTSSKAHSLRRLSQLSPAVLRGLQGLARAWYEYICSRCHRRIGRTSGDRGSD